VVTHAPTVRAARRADTPPLPRSLQVEVTGACNLRCRMCLVAYRPPLARSRASLPLARFVALLDELPDLDEVTLQGLGEPLLAPDLRGMIEAAHARGIRVGFNTNGTLLDREWSEWLVDHAVEWIHVSVDGASEETFASIRRGARLDTVVANLATLLDVKRAARAEHPRVQLNTVVMRRNLTELDDLVRLAHDLGVSRMWIQNLSHDFSDAPTDDYAAISAFVRSESVWSLDPEVVLALDRARATACDLGLELRLPESGSEARVDGEPACDWPWRSAYVGWDGRVQPCCMLMGADRGVLGDLGEQSFGEVWRGAAYRDFRTALLGDEPPAVCRGCSMYRRRF
jgi:radical SAM protein with 4Fe4S-binding SPASM domain